MVRAAKWVGTLVAGGALVFSSMAQAKSDDDADTQAAKPKKHHSKLKGAAVGGVAGHMATHGKKGTAAGAAGGALYQHHKNKKERKQAEKAEKGE